MKSRFVITALLALAPVASAKPAAPPPNGAPSKAVTKEIIDAVAQEMTRSLTMQIDGAPAPTSISYKITEVDVNDAAASLGQLTTKNSNRHFVNIEARVRVSFNGVDNSNFAVPQSDDIDGVAAMPLPLEASPRIARRATWLVTDAAYKEALIQLRAKLESRRAAGTRASDVPGWTTEKPVVSDDAVLVPELESLDELETRAKTLSALFRDQPQIRDSRVAVTSYLERRWYLTTEGTSVSDTRRASGIVIAASGRADDGQPLGQYFLRYGHTTKDLPTDKDLTEEIKKISDNMTALAKAPLMERYRGPVLFEGEGAVGLLRFSLAPNLGGTPVPEGINPQEAKAFGGAFNDQVGVRVIAPSLTITDDPTARDANGKALIGGYKIDDEGVPAQKVTVVKDGLLKTLLLSRTPSQKGQVSNGHARRTADGGAFHGSATNLFVAGKGAVPRKSLEAQVVSQAKAQGLKYGLIVKQFDDSAITAAPEFSRRELIQMVKTADIQLPPPTTMAYRAYPGGKMELVRGAQLDVLPMTAWEDVLGISKEVTTYNFLASDQSQLALKLSGGTDDGFVPSGGIESGIVTPDLILKRVDVRGATGGELPAPLLPKPTSK